MLANQASTLPEVTIPLRSPQSSAEAGHMELERYPGEQVGLRLFLDGLRPVVEQQLGRGSLLHHQIRKCPRVCLRPANTVTQ